MGDSSQSPRNTGELVLYQTEMGTRLHCRFVNGEVWLTQAAIAELYSTTPQNVTMHLAAIYEEGELDAEATCKEFLQVRQEGARVAKALQEHDKYRAIEDQKPQPVDTAFDEAVQKARKLVTRLKNRPKGAN